MKRLYCICIVASLLWQYEGEARTTTTRYKTTTTTRYKTTTPTRYKTTTTTRYPVTTDDPGVNLKGKMVTLSQYSGITFYSPHYHFATRTTTPKPTTTTPKTTPTITTPTTTTPKPTTTTPKTTPTITTPTTTTPKPTTTTPKPTTTTPRTTTTTRRTTTTTHKTTTPGPTPATRGVTVCLRFMTDSNSLTLFKLAPGSPLTFSWSSSSWYTLTWNYYTAVTLNARILLWNSVQPQPWTSVCVVMDSFKNVVQVFEGGFMSIRKISPSPAVWSGEPVLDVSGFDGQVTDLEVWDYPLGYAQVFSYMQNYGSSGSVLTWSNIAYRYRGSVLFEDTYAQQQRQLLHRQEQPIQIERGWGQRLK